MSAFAICIIALIGLSVLGLPIGLAMITASILYLAASGQDMSLAAEQLLNGLNGSYVLLAVPLFIFSAALMNAGSMTDRLLRFCNLLVGRFRGGLGHVNVVQSVIFSGMSGSAIADAAGSGKLIIDMMRRGNAYTASYAAAITAATAVIGPIIPPSIPMVLYALISDASIALLYRSLSLREAYGTVLESARSTAAIGMLIAGALAFNYVVASENIPTTVRSLLAGYELSQWQFLLAVNILLLVLGCLLEGSTILLVVVPVLIPTAQALGIDMVHFGVVVVVNIMIGLVTPPYGLLLFIVAKLSDSSIGAVTRDSLPFILVMIVSLAAITAIPDLVLWLPRQFGYQG